MTVPQLILLTKEIYVTSKMMSGTHSTLEEDEKCKLHSILLENFRELLTLNILDNSRIGLKETKMTAWAELHWRAHCGFLRKSVVSLGASYVRRNRLVICVVSFCLRGYKLNKKHIDTSTL